MIKQYLTEFEQILHTIDTNINTLQTASSPSPDLSTTIKQTNQYISSASLLLAKIHEDESHYQHNNLLEKKYNELNQRRKQLTDLTRQINLNRLNKQNNHNEFHIKEDENDLNLLSNYNEALLQDSLRNLKEIDLNLGNTAINLHQQGEQLNNANMHLERGIKTMEENNRMLFGISCSKKCQKIMLVIINVLLFSIIVLILVIKMLK